MEVLQRSDRIIRSEQKENDATRQKPEIALDIIFSAREAFPFSMPSLLLLLIALVAVCRYVSAADQCCLSCDNYGEEKYYSIDKAHGMCGESCMNPSDYYKYKIFESGLTKADSNAPCLELGYSDYAKTETHGFFNLKMVVDLYSKPKVQDDTKCCSVCTVPGELKYYSIDTRWNQCGECCMNPDDYDLYHKFEKGLTLSNSSTPCADNHFSVFKGIDTHHAGSISMTFDMYAHDP